MRENPMRQQEATRLHRCVGRCVGHGLGKGSGVYVRLTFNPADGLTALHLYGVTDSILQVARVGE